MAAMIAAMIEPGLRCLLAPNPSPMTYLGTNTYIIGTGEVAVLDPGPDDPAHLAAILQATNGERITHILLSHDHHDHSALIPRLRNATGAPVLAHRTGASQVVPDIQVNDGDVLQGGTWRLEAIHTPGHTDDHLCFGMGDICLTADHVMGWASTAIITPRGNLRDYMASLDKLAARPWRRFLSAHGDPMEDPARRIATLRAHRRSRNASILRTLADGPMAVDDIVQRLYATLAPGLQRAARHNVVAHLNALCDTGDVRQETAELFRLAA